MKHININLRPHRLIRNRFALSTVVTTLIILVISVLLGSVVTYFAINVVSTRVQEESLALTKQHVWYSPNGGVDEDGDPTSATQAALMIINTGGRDVVIQKFSIRGQTIAWGNVFYVTTNKTVSDDLDCQPSANAKDDFELTDSDGGDLDFYSAGDSLTLKSGSSMILYINQPDSITINDVGLTVSITLNTAQAMYYVEANVQAYVPSAEGAANNDADVTIRTCGYIHEAFSQGVFVITNYEDSDIIITDIKFIGEDVSGVYAVVGNWAGLKDFHLVAVQYADLATFEPVNGHPLMSMADGASITIPAGYTAVVYFTAGDIGNYGYPYNPVELSLKITGFTDKVAYGGVSDPFE